MRKERVAAVLAAVMIAMPSAAAAQARARTWDAPREQHAAITAPAVAASSYKMHGALAGFAIGAGITALILHSGGSTSLCDRSANQDAMNSTECTGLIAAGGLVGGVAGYFIGARIRRDSNLELKLGLDDSERRPRLDVLVQRKLR